MFSKKDDAQNKESESWKQLFLQEQVLLIYFWNFARNERIRHIIAANKSNQDAACRLLPTRNQAVTDIWN